MSYKQILKKAKKNSKGVPVLTFEEALKAMGKLVCQTCGTKLVAKNELGICCPKCSVI